MIAIQPDPHPAFAIQTVKPLHTQPPVDIARHVTGPAASYQRHHRQFVTVFQQITRPDIPLDSHLVEFAPLVFSAADPAAGPQRATLLLPIFTAGPQGQAVARFLAIVRQAEGKTTNDDRLGV